MNIILLYNLVNIILFPFYIILLLVRLLKDKENFVSFKSRFGIYKTKPKSSQLIWIHAASVGESMIAINLVNELKKIYQEVEFLVTTGTLSSANIVNKWLPAGVYHEFTPIDNFFIVRRFYKYWQPKLGIFIESDIWPTLVSSSAKKCKLLLLNARLSDKSFNKWQKFPKIFQLLTNFFSYITVQSKIDLKKYHSLGCNNVENLGNIKFANKKLQVNEEELAPFKKIFSGKKVFVASSTHKMDESILLDIISQFKEEKINKIYPIIILRHPERVNEITLFCKKIGLKYSLRSSKIKHNILEDDLYIVDSFGELGLFYSISDISFIGGSFEIGNRLGGHNLLEPAYFDNVIIVGPNMTNFQNITNEMISDKACVQVSNTEELKNQILFFLDEKNINISKEYINNARKYVENREKIFVNYLKQICRFFND
jgi:3-deoxy-D-manno-octulosonic-acid transferase